MKRRNADCGKIRRPIKRNKITEGMYGSTTILYMKFLVLWAIVITADFMFMFRFEFLWPFWLLLRSVHDSFKYKGLAFSVLFVCIAITSDLVCLFFIPVHWLLFAASTYVWVQYVWHTDKGICLPTIILWMLFVYLEAGIRWKDSRHMPHLDLCRPFAAHCIGYPVVTLGFGFKSYVGYRMRQRKQREVAKENEFYMQLLQQALPQEDSQDDTILTQSTGVTVTPVTAAASMSSSQNNTQTQNGSVVTLTQIHQSNTELQQHNHNLLPTSTSATTSTSPVSSTLVSSATATSNDDKSYVQIAGQLQQHSGNNNSVHQQQNNVNNNFSPNSNKSAQTRSSTNGNTNSTGSSTSGNSCTSNGHVTGGNNKNNRRSVEKDSITTSSNRINVTSGANTSYHKENLTPSVTRIAINNLTDSTGNHKDWSDTVNISSGNFSLATAAQKEKHSNNCESSNSSSHQQQLPSVSDVQYGCCSSTKKSSGSTIGSQSNGHITQYEIEEVVEPIEKVKGRRNRSKREAPSKDNHHNNNNTSNHSNNHHSNNTNSNHSHSTKDSNSETSSISSSASIASSTSPIANLASQVVSKICENCLKLEADVKKYRTEISHMKQIENELRQKLEANLTNKSYLQAKQKDCDELEKRIQELTSLRQHDIITLQNTERRLTEERRQKQSIEAQLNNEKKARKVAEDKANRPECSESCKQRKQQLEVDLKQMRRDLKTAEDAKEMAQQQGRKFEQELRMFEVEIRNRDSQPGTEMLMSALAAMQDKNCTLEKNLSAETRVKLDLFSALGEAKRQLEIKDSLYRSKKDEVHDLKAKIAQLLAVMPTDSLCMPTCSNTGSSMLRMNDTPPLQGPSSPMMGIGPQTPHQQILSSHQLNQRVSNASVNNNQQQQQQKKQHQLQQQQLQQQQQQQQQLQQQQQQQQQQQNVVSQSPSVGGGVPVSQSGTSNLDPNASIYTPKNPNSMGSGNQAADA